jgi:hypothetical protein
VLWCSPRGPCILHASQPVVQQLASCTLESRDRNSSRSPPAITPTATTSSTASGSRRDPDRLNRHPPRRPVSTPDERLLQLRASVICVILRWTKRIKYQCMPMLLNGRDCSFSLMERHWMGRIWWILQEALGTST